MQEEVGITNYCEGNWKSRGAHFHTFIIGSTRSLNLQLVR